MKQTWFCGCCMKEYKNPDDAQRCCPKWKLMNDAITKDECMVEML